MRKQTGRRQEGEEGDMKETGSKQEEDRKLSNLSGHGGGGVVAGGPQVDVGRVGGVEVHCLVHGVGYRALGVAVAHLYTVDSHSIDVDMCGLISSCF